MSSLDKHHKGHRGGMQAHGRPADGFGEAFMDETDREVSSLTDRAFRSLCIGEEAVYNDSSPAVWQKAFPEGGGVAPQAWGGATFQHSLAEMAECEQALKHGSRPINGATEEAWQPGGGTSRVSSLVKAFSAAENECGLGASPDSHLSDLGDWRRRETNCELWGRSALLSIQKELSEFSAAYHPNWHPSQTADLQMLGPPASSSKSSKTKGGKSSKFQKLSCINFFLHSEFSPFQSWKDYNRLPFEEKVISKLLSTSEFPRWYDSPLYKELTAAHRNQTTECEVKKSQQDQAKDKAPFETPRSMVRQKASAIEKRCESEMLANCPPWRQSGNLVRNSFPANRPCTVSPCSDKSRQKVEGLLPASRAATIHQRVHMLAEGQTSNSSTPFSISQLLAPIIHARQETGTSEILQCSLSPSIGDVRARPASEVKFRDSYKAMASSLLFNLRDNRKRVKSTYSPTKFKNLELVDGDKQPYKQEAVVRQNGRAVSGPPVSGIRTPLQPRVGEVHSVNGLLLQPAQPVDHFERADALVPGEYLTPFSPQTVKEAMNHDTFNSVMPGKLGRDQRSESRQSQNGGLPSVASKSKEMPLRSTQGNPSVTTEPPLPLAAVKERDSGRGEKFAVRQNDLIKKEVPVGKEMQSIPSSTSVVLDKNSTSANVETLAFNQKGNTLTERLPLKAEEVVFKEKDRRLLVSQVKEEATKSVLAMKEEYEAKNKLFVVRERDTHMQGLHAMSKKDGSRNEFVIKPANNNARQEALNVHASDKANHGALVQRQNHYVENVQTHKQAPAKRDHEYSANEFYAAERDYQAKSLLSLTKENKQTEYENSNATYVKTEYGPTKPRLTTEVDKLTESEEFTVGEHALVKQGALLKRENQNGMNDASKMRQHDVEQIVGQLVTEGTTLPKTDALPSVSRKIKAAESNAFNRMEALVAKSKEPVQEGTRSTRAKSRSGKDARVIMEQKHPKRELSMGEYGKDAQEESAGTDNEKSQKDVLAARDDTRSKKESSVVRGSSMPEKGMITRQEERTVQNEVLAGDPMRPHVPTESENKYSKNHVFANRENHKVRHKVFAFNERDHAMQEMLTTKLKAHAQKEIIAIKEKGHAKREAISTTERDVAKNEFPGSGERGTKRQGPIPLHLVPTANENGRIKPEAIPTNKEVHDKNDLSANEDRADRVRQEALPWRSREQTPSVITASVNENRQSQKEAPLTEKKEMGNVKNNVLENRGRINARREELSLTENIKTGASKQLFESKEKVRQKTHFSKDENSLVGENQKSNLEVLATSEKKDNESCVVEGGDRLKPQSKENGVILTNESHRTEQGILRTGEMEVTKRSLPSTSGLISSRQETHPWRNKEGIKNLCLATENESAGMEINAPKYREYTKVGEISGEMVKSRKDILAITEKDPKNGDSFVSKGKRNTELGGHATKHKDRESSEFADKEKGRIKQEARARQHPAQEALESDVNDHFKRAKTVSKDIRDLKQESVVPKERSKPGPLSAKKEPALEVVVPAEELSEQEPLEAKELKNPELPTRSQHNKPDATTSEVLEAIEHNKEDALSSATAESKLEALQGEEDGTPRVLAKNKHPEALAPEGLVPLAAPVAKERAKSAALDQGKRAKPEMQTTREGANQELPIKAPITSALLTAKEPVRPNMLTGAAWAQQDVLAAKESTEQGVFVTKEPSKPETRLRKNDKSHMPAAKENAKLEVSTTNKNAKLEMSTANKNAKLEMSTTNKNTLSEAQKEHYKPDVLKNKERDKLDMLADKGQDRHETISMKEHTKRLDVCALNELAKPEIVKGEDHKPETLAAKQHANLETLVTKRDKPDTCPKQEVKLELLTAKENSRPDKLSRDECVEQEVAATKQHIGRIDPLAAKDHANTFSTKEHAKQEVLTEKEHAETNTFSTKEHAKQEVLTEKEHAKTNTFSTKEHAKQEVLTEKEHAKTNTFSTKEHAKQEVLIEKEHAKTNTFLTKEHAKQEVLTEKEHAKTNTFSTTEHAKQEVLIEKEHAKGTVLASLEYATSCVNEMKAHNPDILSKNEHVTSELFAIQDHATLGILRKEKCNGQEILATKESPEVELLARKEPVKLETLPKKSGIRAPEEHGEKHSKTEQPARDKCAKQELLSVKEHAKEDATAITTLVKPEEFIRLENSKQEVFAGKEYAKSHLSVTKKPDSDILPANERVTSEVLVVKDHTTLEALGKQKCVEQEVLATKEGAKPSVNARQKCTKQEVFSRKECAEPLQQVLATKEPAKPEIFSTKEHAKPEIFSTKEPAKSEILSTKEPAKSEILSTEEPAKPEIFSTKEPAKPEIFSTKEHAKPEIFSTKEPAKSEILFTKEPAKPEIFSTKEPAKSEILSTKEQARQEIFSTKEHAKPEILSRKEPAKQEIFSREGHAKQEIISKRGCAKKDIFSTKEQAKQEIFSTKEPAKPEMFSRREPAKPEIFSRREPAKPEMFSRREPAKPEIFSAKEHAKVEAFSARELHKPAILSPQEHKSEEYDTLEVFTKGHARPNLLIEECVKNSFSKNSHAKFDYIEHTKPEMLVRKEDVQDAKPELYTPAGNAKREVLTTEKEYLSRNKPVIPLSECHSAKHEVCASQEKGMSAFNRAKTQVFAVEDGDMKDMLTLREKDRESVRKYQPKEGAFAEPDNEHLEQPVRPKLDYAHLSALSTKESNHNKYEGTMKKESNEYPRKEDLNVRALSSARANQQTQDLRAPELHSRHVAPTLPLQVNGRRGDSIQPLPTEASPKPSAESYFSVEDVPQSLVNPNPNPNPPLWKRNPPMGRSVEKTRTRERTDLEKMDALQYYDISNCETKASTVTTGSGGIPRSEEAEWSRQELGEGGLPPCSVDLGKAHTPAPQSNPSSPSLGKPTLFKVKDNTFRSSPVTKAVKPYFHKRFPEEVRLDSSRESLNGSEKGDDDHGRADVQSPAYLSNRFARPYHGFQLPSDFTSARELRGYYRRHPVTQEDECCSLASAVSEEVDSRTLDVADDAAANVDNAEEKEIIRSEHAFGAHDITTPMGKPPTVPPKTEKALRRAKKLTTRRIRKTEAKPMGDDNSGADQKSARAVASVPSSPTDLLIPHRPVHGPPPAPQFRIEPSYVAPAANLVAQHFPMTQRKLLQDPNSGQYFVVDMPVPVKTKTFFDPETGKFIQLSVRQSPEGTLSHASSMELLNPPYVLYPGFLPVPVSSVPPLRSTSQMSAPAALTEDQGVLELNGPRRWETQPYAEPVYKPQSQCQEELQYNEDKDSASPRNLNIISMSELEDFAMEST